MSENKDEAENNLKMIGNGRIEVAESFEWEMTLVKGRKWKVEKQKTNGKTEKRKRERSAFAGCTVVVS
jgi:hypothetical protein